MGNKETYITLKEAAKKSGYAPDYVGQLIRSGKLHGKQVYSNVQWMTTEEALQSYLDQKSGKKASSEKPRGSMGVAASVFSEETLMRASRISLYLLIGIGVLFSLFLFYVLSVNLDKRLQARAVERAASVELSDIPLPRAEDGALLRPL